MFKQLDYSSSGNSLQGYIKCSYADLVELFGQPRGSGDDYKVSTEWVLGYFPDSTPDERVDRVVKTLDNKDRPQFIVSLYDYKMTELYDGGGGMSVAAFRALPSYDWHIGGDTKEEARLLTEYVTRKISELKCQSTR